MLSSGAPRRSASRRIPRNLVLVVALAACAVFAASALAKGTASVFGGVTSQRWPVVVELNKTGSQVVRAVTGLDMPCTSGATARLKDGYVKVNVKKGRFTASFGPETERNADGTTTDFEGGMSGTLNKSHTKISGKWHLKGTDHDNSGAVTDTCDSGNVTWSAKQ